MISIIKLDLDELCRQVLSYEATNLKKPKYIIMSQDTLSIIEYHSCASLEFNQKYLSDEIFGVKIAINDTLKLGETDIV